MKKLDKLILKAFLGPFILTFAVVVFILLTQHMIKYFDDFVGKDLGWEVFAKLSFYFCLNLTPMALPLAVLISSLMTYGNLGQHFELTAIKSAGISMTRTLLPIFVFVLILTAIGFYFNNVIVPKANLKAYSLLYDVRQKKPSVDLKEGAFYNGIPGYSIKVNKKNKDGKSLKGVMIYDHSEGRGNTNVTIADSGIMQTVYNEQYLQLELFKGNQYAEVVNNNGGNSQQEFVRSKYIKTKVMFSLESFALKRTDEDLFATDKIMLNIKQLDKGIDSLNKESGKTIVSMAQNARTFYNYHQRYDRVYNDKIKPQKGFDINTISKEKKALAITSALNSSRNILSWSGTYVDRIKYFTGLLKDFEIEKIRKYTQSIAIIIMFLIGAPLGAIIKKGGLGVPIIISISFFVVYYVLMTMGQKFGKEGVMDVIWGMWLPNLVLLPFGLVFMNQARKDSRLFEFDYFVVLWDRFRASKK